MIACVLEVKDVLKRMIFDLRWNEYVSTLFNWQNDLRAQALTDAVRATIFVKIVKILNT